MGRAISRIALLGILLSTAGCEYYNDLKKDDVHILILIGSLVGMMVLFGSITRSKNEILEENVVRVQRVKEAIHAAEDEVRLKRDGLYQAQQELLGHYDKMLTEKQRKAPELVALRRRLLELERDILAAENRRNQLQKETTA